MISIPSYKKIISHNIKCLLDIYSMSILELSNKSGVSYSPLYSIVSNKTNPTFETLYKISEVFNINIAQLIGDLPLDKTIDSKSLCDIPILDWEGKVFDVKKQLVVNRIKVAKTSNTSDKAFALKAPKNSLFLSNTILVFDVITNPLEKYIGNIILVSSENSPVVLKKLIADGKTLFLECLNGKLPTRQILSTDVVIAYLIQSITSFV